MFNKNIQNSKSNLSKLNFTISVLATLIVLAFASAAFAVSPKPVDLGRTSNFAVLAGSGITNTGATSVSGTAGGDMGSSPTTTFVETGPVTTSGTKYIAESAVVDKAKEDLVSAYDDAKGRNFDATISADLGGKALTPGVYKSDTSMGLTGTLTLDAKGDPNAVFIFQIGSTLTTASASKIVLLNGTQACNVFWQVGSSATFGTKSSFVGHVFALTSITATTGASFNGQLLAQNGAVTLDTNIIVNDLCVAAPVETATPKPEASPVETATPKPEASPVETATPTPTAPVPAASALVETATPEPIMATEVGGKLPRTDNSWFLPFIAGVVLVGAGTTYMVVRRRRT
jgi:hypothetical protein